MPNSGKSLLDLLREEKSIHLKGGLYHRTQIELAYNSNRIEGSGLSEEQTRFIYETNSFIADRKEPTSVDDIVETVNHFRCFDYMIDVADQPLTQHIIKTFHKYIKDNTSDSRLDWFNVGDYKQRANVVGNKRTTAPSKVERELKKLLESYNNKQVTVFEDIVDFHYRFEAIHPFQDGNGRVGRMIMFKECLRNNIMPFIIDEKHKLFYYRGLSEYENEKGYLIDICYSAQDCYSELVRYFTAEE